MTAAAVVSTNCAPWCQNHEADGEVPGNGTCTATFTFGDPKLNEEIFVYDGPPERERTMVLNLPDADFVLSPGQAVALLAVLRDPTRVVGALEAAISAVDSPVVRHTPWCNAHHYADHPGDRYCAHEVPVLGGQIIVTDDPLYGPTALLNVEPKDGYTADESAEIASAWSLAAEVVQQIRTDDAGDR